MSKRIPHHKKDNVQASFDALSSTDSTLVAAPFTTEALSLYRNDMNNVKDTQ